MIYIDFVDKWFWESDPIRNVFHKSFMNKATSSKGLSIEAANPKTHLTTGSTICWDSKTSRLPFWRQCLHTDRNKQTTCTTHRATHQKPKQAMFTNCYNLSNSKEMCCSLSTTTYYKSKYKSTNWRKKKTLALRTAIHTETKSEKIKSTFYTAGDLDLGTPSCGIVWYPLDRLWFLVWPAGLRQQSGLQTYQLM